MLLTALLLATALPATTPALSSAAPLEAWRTSFAIQPEGESLETPFNYDYIDAGITFGDFTGLQLEGSFNLDGPWIAVGGFTAASDDGPDLTVLRGGAGYVMPINEKLDGIGTAQLEYADLFDSELGLRVRGGVRFAAQEKLELFGGLELRTVFKNDWVLDGGAVFAINESLSAVGKLELGDYDQITLGLRFRL